MGLFSPGDWALQPSFAVIQSTAGHAQNDWVLSARNFNLPKRGVIAAGNFADLVLFDGEKIKDNADFLNPTRPAAGICQVYVNGQLAYRQGALTAQRAGPFFTRQV